MAGKVSGYIVRVFRYERDISLRSWFTKEHEYWTYIHHFTMIICQCCVHIVFVLPPSGQKELSYCRFNFKRQLATCPLL